MFSVLTAISTGSTGGLYVPAVYIVFYVAFIFWLLLLNRSCSTDTLTRWPILDPSFSIAAFVHCPLLNRVISASSEHSAQQRLTLLHSCRHSIINDSADDGGTPPRTYQEDLPPSELLGRIFLPWRLNLVNQAIVSGCLGVHEVIAFSVPSHFFYRLTRVVGQNVV